MPAPKRSLRCASEIEVDDKDEGSGAGPVLEQRYFESSGMKASGFPLSRTVASWYGDKRICRYKKRLARAILNTSASADKQALA